MAHASPATRLVLGFHGLPDTPELHLSVDGMTPAGPNLSHWPGNRTPARWKADLSTGIALEFARASAADQEAFLAGADTVLNDHYDTDGFLSLLAILRPEVAFDREELCLAAAATGDFGVFQTWRAFAVDRIVARLADPGSSPLADQFADRSGPEKAIARYRWLLLHAEEVLDRPETHSLLWRDELSQVREEIQAGRRGAVDRTLHAELGLSVLRTRDPVHRMTLNTLAAAFRVLHVQTDADGPRYRYHDRTESWFELATFRALPRRDLRPLAERLRTLEPDHDGAAWCADPPGEPIPELYFGLPGAQEYGQITRRLRPSALPPEVVEREVARHFAAPAG